LFVNIGLLNTGRIAHNEERASELRNIQKDGDIRWTVTENAITGLTSIKRSYHCLIDLDVIPNGRRAVGCILQWARIGCLGSQPFLQ
jgi:hypothetical protein